MSTAGRMHENIADGITEIERDACISGDTRQAETAKFNEEVL
jgi:hypothetical protein